MCGVPLERRKVERRVQQNHTNLTCPSCQHVNEPGHKFCAMCGNRVDRRVKANSRAWEVLLQSHPTAVANAQLPAPQIEAAVVAVEPSLPAATETAPTEVLAK